MSKLEVRIVTLEPMRVASAYGFGPSPEEIAWEKMLAFAKKKGFGDDITEGKRTMIVLHALKSLPKEEAERLTEILNMHTRDESLIREALALLSKAGSVEYAKSRSRELIKKAWKEAEGHIPESGAKKRLEALVNFLAERDI